MELSLRANKIVTVAGTGEPGYSGDGGAAVHACLNEPKNIAFDSRGHLYIADSENHVIRMVDGQTGLMSTIAGRADTSGPAPQLSSPFPEYAGSDEPEDLLAEPESLPAFNQSPDISGTIRYMVGHSEAASRFSGDGGPARNATLNFPSAVAVGADGTLYIADTWNHRIRKVDPGTGIISTIAGTGQPKFSGDGGPGTEAALNEPVALAIADDGMLYIADQSNNRIRMLNTVTGEITTLAGTGESAYSGDDGPAVEACLAGPSGLALDGEGNLYVSDTFSSRVRVIALATGIIQTKVGDGGEFRFLPGETASSLSLARPYGIAVTKAGDVLITDSDNHLVRQWASQGLTVVAGNGQAQFSGEGQPSEQASLNFPFGVAVHPLDDSVYIADTFNHRIRKIVPL